MFYLLNLEDKLNAVSKTRPGPGAYPDHLCLSNKGGRYPNSTFKLNYFIFSNDKTKEKRVLNLLIDCLLIGIQHLTSFMLTHQGHSLKK